MSHFFFENDIEFCTLEEGKTKRKVKAHDGKLMLVEMHFENGAAGSNHTHPHEQITYCLAGEFEFTVGAETKTVKAGDSLYVPPNVEHSCRLKSSKGRVIDVFTPVREDFIQK